MESLVQLTGKKLKVSTIDAIQGQENDVIYISLTRSNADQQIGFLQELRRMNVAMTRARKKLIMVGDSATLSSVGFYARLLEYAEKIGGYNSIWSYSFE